jgi:hypothetical protein
MSKAMFNIQKYIIDRFVKELQNAYQESYSILEPQYGNMIEWCGYLALENIANSNTLYHDVEHTIMVTMVGQSILKGKHLSEGGVSPRDWLHFMMALLCHDIGYVKGICRQDTDEEFATGIDGQTVRLSSDWTDAVLQPYHVDRGKLFIRERFGGKLLHDIDCDLICSYIEMTRFPIPAHDDFYKDTIGYHGLARSADFIGQLGDPNYLRKIPALYYEFQETGMSNAIGYANPGHVRREYTKFYWNVVRPHIQDALRYLSITQEGKQWIANLHSHVFEVEHGGY